MKALFITIATFLAICSYAVDFDQPINGLLFANPPLPMNDTVFSQLDQVDPAFFVNKTALVIGGSTGMGFATAKYLKDIVGFGRVIATSRFPNAYPDYPSNIELWKLELADPKDYECISRDGHDDDDDDDDNDGGYGRRCRRGSIAKFVRKVKREVENLVLIHFNAGRVSIGSVTGALSDRVQTLWRTNYFGHGIIFRALQPELPTTGYSRVLFTSSITNDQDIIPPGIVGLDYVGTPSYEYTGSKRAIATFARAWWTQLQNANIPASDWPDQPNNGQVCIVYPPPIVTQLGHKAILTEDSTFADEQKVSYAQGIEIAGLPKEQAGKAFGQLAQLVTPPLHNYIVNVTDPLVLPTFAQIVFYQDIQYERNVTVSTELDAWPPALAKREITSQLAAGFGGHPTQ